MAARDDASRLAHLAEDHWIDYPRARAILKELERLVRSPQRTRLQGLLIHGESDIGKSMIIQKFLRAHPARGFNAETGFLQVDVLAVEMPSAPQERRLHGQLLMALNAPYRPGDRLAAVEFTALTLLSRVGATNPRSRSLPDWIALRPCVLDMAPLARVLAAASCSRTPRRGATAVPTTCPRKRRRSRRCGRPWSPRPRSVLPCRRHRHPQATASRRVG